MSDNLWAAFVRTVERHPERPAFIQGDTRTSFRSWHERALGFAERFRVWGVEPRDRVVVRMDSSPEMAAALLGAWAAGGIPAILPAMAPASHLAHAVALVRPRVVMTDAAMDAPGEADDVVHAVPAMVPEGGHPIDPYDTASAVEPASIVFTSGSTGRPKGVTQSHGNLLTGCRTVAGYLGLRQDDVVVCPIPWSFDYGYGQLLATAVLGVTQVLPTLPNPTALCQAIAASRPTVLPGVPSLWTYLFRGVSPIRTTDLSSLRLITNTGGAIPRPVLNDMLDAFSACRIVLNYGLTESYRTSYLDPALVATRSDSIGKGMPGVDVQIVREDGTIAAPSEIGEIVHRGICVFLGYWGDAETSRKALRADPLAPPGSPDQHRTLYTGDLGYKDAEGFITYVGRRDRQIKSMGVRVSPGEVEALLHATGLVREAAVFGVPNEMIGDEVCAAVVAQEAMSDLRQRLVQSCQRTMSPHMMPRRWLIKAELPKTPNGKIDYPALKSEVVEGAKKAGV